MIKQRIDEMQVEIRNRNRDQILFERRKQYALDRDMIQQAQINKLKIYQMNDLQQLVEVFMDQSRNHQDRFEMLIAANQFVQDEDNSTHTIKKLIMIPGLINQMKLTVHDENLPLYFREYQLQLLADMLNTNFDLCAMLLELEVQQLIVQYAKIGYETRQHQFLYHSLKGIGNIVSTNVWIRNYFIENEIDKLLINVLQCDTYQDKGQIYKGVAYILNGWFRDKMVNINVDLYFKAIQHLVPYSIEMNNDKEYFEDTVWFIHQFIAMTLDILNQQESNQLIEALLNVPYIANFIRLKLNDTEFLSCVASIRLLAKLIKCTTQADQIVDLFYQDIQKLFIGTVNNEVYIMKNEILKLGVMILRKCPECTIFNDQFNICIEYYKQHHKIHALLLELISLMDLQKLSNDDKLHLIDCVSSTLQGVQVDANRIIGALKILIKLATLNVELHQNMQGLIMRIQQLQFDKHEDIYKLSGELLQILNGTILILN